MVSYKRETKKTMLLDSRQQVAQTVISELDLSKKAEKW